MKVETQDSKKVMNNLLSEILGKLFSMIDRKSVTRLSKVNTSNIEEYKNSGGSGLKSALYQENIQNEIQRKRDNSKNKLILKNNNSTDLSFQNSGPNGENRFKRRKKNSEKNENESNLSNEISFHNINQVQTFVEEEDLSKLRSNNKSPVQNPPIKRGGDTISENESYNTNIEALNSFKKKFTQLRIENITSNEIHFYGQRTSDRDNQLNKGEEGACCQKSSCTLF